MDSVPKQGQVNPVQNRQMPEKASPSPSPSRKEVPEAEESEEREEIDEETTCCHRATICNPRIRDIPVTATIFTCFNQRVTWARVFWLMTLLLLILMGWAVLYFILGKTMLPGGGSFGLFSLIVFAYLLGWALTYIPYLNLPPICGMLLAGMIIRNTDYYNIYEELGVKVTSKIRTFCLTFVMIRAGLQVTTTALMNHAVFILILALLPCSVELVVLSGCCKAFLSYPWDWALMSGAVLTAMSPVVVINGMLALAERGYGEDKGLTTLLSTAAIIDDVHVLFMFSVFYSLVFRTDARKHEWSSYFLGAFWDVSLGFLVGTLLGSTLIFLPHRSHKYAIWYRLTALILACLMCTTGATKITITGGGYWAALVVSFIAITGWKVLSTSFDPILLGVIGADIDFSSWTAARFGLYCACILIGLTARSFTALSITFCTPFNWKERAFVAIAWLPKGTMQAALAPMAFETAKNEGDPEKIQLAQDILRISVIAVVFLSALGSMAINIAGPRLLNQITVEEHQRERRLSYLRLLSLQPVRRRRPPTINTNTVTESEV